MSVVGRTSCDVIAPDIPSALLVPGEGGRQGEEEGLGAYLISGS